ncbi:hypothetical protein Tco_0915831 [Tanacetum coccineum]
MNYYEHNPCFDSNYSGFDQFEPPQFLVIHQPIREKTCAELLAEERAANINTQPMQYSVVHQPPQEETSLEFLQDKRNLINSMQTFLRKFNRFSFYETPKVISLAWETIFEIKYAFEDKKYQPEGILELFRKLHDNVQNIHEELAEYINTPSWNRPTISCDDDDDEYSFATQEYLMTCFTAITPDPPKMDSLIMVDKHLNTILETESDEFIKSSVENLVQNPSESEVECECDVPDCDDSQTTNFLMFSNHLFDDSTSSDDESSHEEVIHEIGFKTYSNPLFDFDEEIISSEFNPIHNEDPDSTPKNDRFDAESYLLESLLNHDTLMASSPKVDSTLDEFAAFQANSDTIIESLPTFPIPVEDSDSLREEINIFPGPEDSIPPVIESDDYDLEVDDNSTSLPEFESFHVDYPDLGDSTIDVVEDIPIDVPNILPTHPTLHMDFDFIPSHNDLGSDLDVSSPSEDRNKIYNPGICIEVKSTRFLATFAPMIDTLLPFSSEHEDKVFNHGVLATKEKSPPSSSHRRFKASKLFHHQKARC